MTALVTDNLSLVAGAPSGIHKLRGLVIDLAVRGLLIRANESIGSAPAEAAQRDGDNWPFPIPAHWRWHRLSELNPSFQNGASSRGEVDGIPVTVIRLADIKSGEISLDDPRTLTLERSTVEKHELLGGDLLVIRVNGSADLVGRFIVCRDGLQAIPCDHFIRARFRADLVDAAYLKVVGDAGCTRTAISGLFVSTAGQKTVNQGHIATLSVPLPPLEEQRSIVAKVDELMALCDRLEAEQADAEAAHAKLVEAVLASLTQARDAADFRARWQQLAEHFHALFTTEASVDALKQTVMQLGVQGRLSGGTARSKWRLQTINEFCTVQGGIQKTPLRAPVRHHFPYLRVANVQRGRIDIAQLERYELAAEELQRWRLNAGDLLIVEGNGSESEIGRCAIWHGEVDDCVYQNHLMRVRPTGDDAVEYLALYLNSPVGTAHMRRLAITTSGLFNLSVGKIRSIPVELPPPADQHRIVAKVGELLGLCDQLRSRLAAARETHEQVAAVLVEQAVAVT